MGGSLSRTTTSGAHQHDGPLRKNRAWQRVAMRNHICEFARDLKVHNAAVADLQQAHATTKKNETRIYVTACARSASDSHNSTKRMNTSFECSQNDELHC